MFPDKTGKEEAKMTREGDNGMRQMMSKCCPNPRGDLEPKSHHGLHLSSGKGSGCVLLFWAIIDYNLPLDEALTKVAVITACLLGMMHIKQKDGAKGYAKASGGMNWGSPTALSRRLDGTCCIRQLFHSNKSPTVAALL